MRAVTDGTRAMLVVIGLARIAVAEPNRAADQTFERGRELMAKKQFAEACAAFEQSQRLDPQFGTLFNLADCEVQLGKLATAWGRYRELERTDSNQERRALSAQLAAQLERRMPKLVIAVSARPTRLHVVLDGVDSTALVGVPIPVDFGDHAIAADAPGFHAMSTTATINAEGRVVRVDVRLDPLDAAESPTIPIHATAPPIDAPSRRVPIIAFATGGALVVGGLVTGTFAYTTWHHATSCTSCDPVTLSHDARVLGDVSTALVIAGLASAGVGLWLWHVESSSAQLVPTAGASPVGVALAGSF